MVSVTDFFQHFNIAKLIMMLIAAAASLFCITFHELSHGLIAYRLGDPTAKNAGRLTLNPIKHIDWLGFLMMITIHVGWAKPVPVNMSYFKHPKRDMALTALAGPVSNLILTFFALLIANGILHFAGSTVGGAYAVVFFLYIAVLSVGLAVFNLIPVSPLDGSKVLLALLPERAYYTVLRYERIGMLIIVILTWTGVLNGPLSVLMEWAIKGLCVLSRFPFAVVQELFF